MFARILKSGTLHDVVGYVTREFHDKSKYTSGTWRVIDSADILTLDYKRTVQSFIVRHLETDHPHFHIVYNRVDMDGKATNECNN